MVRIVFLIVRVITAICCNNLRGKRSCKFETRDDLAA